MMRNLVIAILAAARFNTPVLAKSADTMKACVAGWQSMPADDKVKTTYKVYSTNSLKNGGPKPAPVTIAASPQQRMKDCAARWGAIRKDDSADTRTYQKFSSTYLKKA